MSIVNLNQVTLTLGGNCLLNKVNWQLESQEKIALVGRNGAGKSTLLQLLAGLYTPDSGHINRLSGLKVASLIQDVPIACDESVYHFLVKSLGEVGEVLANYHRLSQEHNLDQLAAIHQQMEDFQAWDWLPQIEAMASRLSLDPTLNMKSLSGGMKRRVLLAAALIAKPELLLLDEPTNHLDIDAIEWLESYLKTYNGTVVVVTHDREFLNQVANTIIEIDRGKIYPFHCNYETYLDRREAQREAELKQEALFDKRLTAEEAWLRQGVKARRTRNEGRVRALKALREKAKARRSELGQVKSIALEVKRSGNVVIEADQIEYHLPNKPLIENFSFLLTRGDKVGIIGPNGCGKTTLVRLLLGEIAPQRGSVKAGSGLEIAYFDQLRSQLNENESVMQNVAEGSDFVTVQGKSKHVASYLKEFLFSPERFTQPVSTLSGGEKNRLLLAKLLAKPVNLLVMDEPTNDLDIDTLELLESVLLDYSGTILLISHDRAFINNVVTSVLVWEGKGRFTEFVGNYEDYQQHKKEVKETLPLAKSVKKTASVKKLSFNEQQELAGLPKKIEQLEDFIAKAQEKLADPDFYKQKTDDISQFNQTLSDSETALKALYARWELLEEQK